jgi:hypothetical protein
VTRGYPGYVGLGGGRRSSNSPATTAHPPLLLVPPLLLHREAVRTSFSVHRLDRCYFCSTEFSPDVGGRVVDGTGSGAGAGLDGDAGVASSAAGAASGAEIAV